MVDHRQCGASVFDISSRTGFVGLVLAVAFTMAVFAVPTIQAQTWTVLHNFTGGPDGDQPLAGLSMDRAGNLYGTASYGGNREHCSDGCGTVYMLEHKNSGWIFSTLYEFTGPDGENPAARVIIGPDGSLYGTTTAGGAAGKGTVFRLQPPPSVCKSVFCPWTETVLYSFQGGSDGENPTYGDLTFDQAGNIYGTTPFGGSNQSGTVFELSPVGSSWSETVIYDLDCLNCYEPYAGVIFDNAGNLYGTTSGGGVGDGTVYELTHSSSGWSGRTIYSFAFPGGAFGGLTFDSSGNLYGVTSFGPLVYELSPSNGGWTYNALYSLEAGYLATGQVIMDPAGNLYFTIVLGTLEVYRLTPSGGQWSLTGLNGSAGEEPYGTVVMDAQGNIYGTASDDCVFEVTP